MNRKKFIQLGSLGLSAISLKPTQKAAAGPIVVATWDSGMPVNEAAWKVLSTNGKSIDAVEAGAIYIEDTINCCVGLGGYPDRNGIVTLDASIMDEKANCGAVAGLEQIRHPISVARKVMENTPHVMLVGKGAQDFALQNGFKLETPKLSPEARTAYEDWLKKSNYQPQINIENKKKENGPFAPNFFDDGSANHDTMGLIAMDNSGDISSAVTTSGMAFKIHGRVGDSPIVGAGLFVDNEIGAAVSSGVGEEVIRICGTHLVVEMMRLGKTPLQACKIAVERIVKRDPAKAKELQVGFLAINKKGEVGAYSVLKGFAYCVKTNTETRLYESEFLLG